MACSDRTSMGLGRGQIPIQGLIHTVRDRDQEQNGEQDWHNRKQWVLVPGFRLVWIFLHDISEPTDPIPGPYAVPSPDPVQCKCTIMSWCSTAEFVVWKCPHNIMRTNFVPVSIPFKLCLNKSLVSISVEEIIALLYEIIVNRSYCKLFVFPNLKKL